MTLSVSQIIEEIVARQLALPQVSSDTCLAGKTDTDLAPILRVVLAVEEAFPVVIPDLVIERFVCVQDLVDFVERGLQKGEHDA